MLKTEALVLEGKVRKSQEYDEKSKLKKKNVGGLQLDERDALGILRVFL